MGTNVEDIEKGEEEAEEEFDSSKAEQVKLVIDDCQRLLIPDLSSIIGCWGLIDSDAVTGKSGVFIHSPKCLLFFIEE